MLLRMRRGGSVNLQKYSAPHYLKRPEQNKNLRQRRRAYQREPIMKTAMGIFAGVALALNGQANEVIEGDWAAGILDGNKGFYAATVNDSELVFGEYCTHSTKD